MIEREETPLIPGVYEGVRLDETIKGEFMRTIRVQLDEDGQWWPYPYSFSGWRTSELELFHLTPLADETPDVPAIKNPEDAYRISWFTSEFMALPGVKREDAVKLAERFVLELNI